MIYLDNAATTFPKPRCVIEEINFCLKKYCGNPGRSSHKLSVKSGEAIYLAREEIARLLTFSSPEQVVFTCNATYGLNLAIKTLITERCHVITSDFEHNSVIRPLEKLKATLGVEYSQIDSDSDIEHSLQSLLRDDTRAVVCSVASNVTGNSLPLDVLSKFACKHSLLLIVDGSQAAGHMDINLSKTPCDAFVAPGHKALFGMQGSGFVCFKDKRRKESFIEGGSGSESVRIDMPYLLPEGYEAGTLATPAIVGLYRGVKYISEIGITNIQEKLSKLTLALDERLRSISGINCYKCGSGILSFNYKDVPSSIISSELDGRNICTRNGLHCAPSIHRKLGTLNQGAIRVSFSYLNKMSDVDKCYRAIKETVKTI